MKHKTTYAYETQIFFTVLLFVLPIVLFIVNSCFLFSEVRVGDMWLSDLCGHCFSVLCIPSCILAFLLYRKSETARCVYPGWQTVLSILIVIDTIILVINCAVVISTIIAIIDNLSIGYNIQDITP